MHSEWANKAVTRAYKKAKQRAGDGWSLFGPDLRRALVCDEIVTRFAAMDEDFAGEKTVFRMISVCQFAQQMDF